MSTPVDSLKFIAAYVKDQLEHIEFQFAGTHEDEEMADFATAVKKKVLAAAEQHFQDDNPSAYSDGVRVRTTFTINSMTYVEYPSHPAQGEVSA